MGLLAGLMIAAASPLLAQRPDTATVTVVRDSGTVQVVLCSPRDCITAAQPVADHADLIRAATTRARAARVTQIAFRSPSRDTAWVVVSAAYASGTVARADGSGQADVFSTIQQVIRVERRNGQWVPVPNPPGIGGR